MIVVGGDRLFEFIKAVGAKSFKGAIMIGEGNRPFEIVRVGGWKSLYCM